MRRTSLPATTGSISLVPAIASASVALALLAGPIAAQQDSVEVPITDRDGQNIGSAQLTKQESGVRIRMQASGLSPGKHGLHIHSQGACEPPAFESAGPHFSPHDRSHGFLDAKGPHAGDLPVLVIDSDGKLEDYDVTTTRVALDQESLLDSDGSSLIIHAKPDDYLTDTGGGTGDRIACGVISQ